MAENVIEVRELTKVFNGLTAVDRVSFTIEEGEIFGFLGPNGAGKTTTISMLTTVLRPTSGSALVCGHDILRESMEVRRSTGLVPQEYTADEDLTGLENVLLCASLYGIPKEEARSRAKELLELVQLNEAKDRPVETYSGGMRRRLELACGLVNRPRVLFLDEPTLGLDVQTRAAVWDYIRLLKERFNMTVFLTTHYMDEADHLCDRVAIIDMGRIVAMDSPRALKSQIGGDIIEIRLAGTTQGITEEEMRSIEGVREVAVIDGGYRLKVVNGEEAAPLILDVLRERAMKVTRISIVKPTLDEVFLEYTGRTLREEEGSREDIFRHRIVMRRARP